MVSKNTKNILIGIVLVLTGMVLMVGLLLSIPSHQTTDAAAAPSEQAATPPTAANPPYTGVFQYCKGSFQVTDPSKGYTAVVISLYINNTGDQTYSFSPYDWIIEINNKTYNSYMSGDFENSDIHHALYVSPGNEGSATFAYRVDDKLVVGSPLKLIYKCQNNTSNDVVSCTIQSLVDQSTLIHRIFSTGEPVTVIDSSPTSATEPEETHVKTLADKEPDTESEVIHSSEEPVDNVDSSTHTIFDYCSWQTRTTRTISEYAKAPENKIYVIVTLKLDNTGDQTYSTNPNYWHLKIGERYYQYNSDTFDKAINFLSTDVAPGGKLTTEIVYLVDGEPPISDMDLYYDGPGSDRTIHS